MKKHELILIGGGGHCKSCIDVIEAEGKFKIKGIIDMDILLGSKVLGYEFIGTVEDIPQLVSEGFSFLITYTHMGNPERRHEMFEILLSLKAKLPVIKAPSAIVSGRSQIGKGTIIMHQGIVNVDAKIGENCIINTQALIEHDAIVQKNCHISTNATVNANCTIQMNTFIGSGSVVKNGISITKDVLIGAGSLVVKPILIPGNYYGVPVTNYIYNE